MSICIYVQLYPANCVPTLTLLAIIQTPCTIGITLFSIYLLLINIISIYSLPYWVSYSKVYTLITLLHSESSRSSCSEKTYSFESIWLYSSSWFEPGTRFSGGSRKSHSKSGSGLPQKVILKVVWRTVCRCSSIKWINLTFMKKYVFLNLIINCICNFSFIFQAQSRIRISGSGKMMQDWPDPDMM